MSVFQKENSEESIDKFQKKIKEIPEAISSEIFKEINVGRHTRTSAEILEGTS